MENPNTHIGEASTAKTVRNWFTKMATSGYRGFRTGFMLAVALGLVLIISHYAFGEEDKDSKLKSFYETKGAIEYQINDILPKQLELKKQADEAREKYVKPFSDKYDALTQEKDQLEGELRSIVFSIGGLESSKIEGFQTAGAVKN